MNRGLSLLVCLLLVLAGLAVPVGAKVAEDSHRLKKIYDFEDTDDRGNKIGHRASLMPRNWFIVGRKALGVDEKFHRIPLHQSLESRAGYPNFAEVGFDKTVKASGDFSLRLGLSGGRTGAYIQHAAVGVKPQSDYRVSAKVNTKKLDYAWAELRAYFVDQSGKRIEKSYQRSDPITTDGQWKTVSLKLTGDYDDAAYIGIEVHIIQPKRNQADPIGAHQVVPADISGGAWFDDIGVWELPSVSVSTGVRTNIITSKTPPKLRARVRDLTGQKLRATLTVYNHRYEKIDRIEDDIDKEGWSWTPDLKGRYGWYWADLEIHEVDANNSPRMKVARSLAGFLWMPRTEGVGSDDRSRFMVVAEDVPTEHLPLLGELMEQTKLTSLTVSGWEPNSTPTSTAVRARKIEPILRALVVRRGRVAVSFWPMPVELVASLNVDKRDPLNLLTKPEDQWAAYAKPFLSPLGQRLSHWQVGSSSQPKAFLARDLASDLEAARRGIRGAAPSPQLVVPWRLDQTPRKGALTGRDSYAVAWPQGITPGQLAEALKGWPKPVKNARLDIELANASGMTHQRRIADLMLRVLHAWEAEAGVIGLTKPWTQAHERHTSFTPDPVLGVYATLARQLEGQRVIGRMPLGPGLQAMILDGQQGGMLAVWNESADKQPTTLEMYLGDNPVAVGPFGNRSKLESVNGKQRLVIGKTPTIIRGVNKHVAMLRAGFKLNEPFIESLQIAHRRTLKIRNPWPRTMNGYYAVTGPKRWAILPSRKHFSIAPGKTAEIPIAMRFPIHESGGYKRLSANLVFNVGSDYQLTLYAPMEVGLKGVQFSATAIVEPGSEPGTVDAVVTLNATNTSDAKRSLKVFAGLYGHARRELIIPGIDPGEFVSRRIRFKDVGKQLGKYPIRCGVREANGPAVLNKTLELLAPKREDPKPEIAGVKTDTE